MGCISARVTGHSHICDGPIEAEMLSYNIDNSFFRDVLVVIADISLGFVL